MLGSLFRKRSLWLVGILGLLMGLLSVVHVSLRAEVIELIYLVICSVFLSILVLSLLAEIIKTTDIEKSRLSLIVFFSAYILLSSWLCLSKGVPEYIQITTFEEKRSDLVYNLLTVRKEQRKNAEFESKLELAELYLHASGSIERIESHVINKGANMMHLLLLEKIKQNKAEEYRDDMMNLAEVVFTYKSKKLSKQWYKRAFDAGRLDP